MASRRPDPTSLTKYEKPLPVYLEDFFVHFNRAYVDNQPLEHWQKDLVDEMAQSLIEKIQHQWKESSKTRRAFVNMNKELVWDNETDKIMKLTRRNLALFEDSFRNHVDEYIMATIKERIDPIREELEAIVVAVSASDEEQTAVRAFCSGDTFFFEDLAQHLVEQTAWEAELRQRHPVVEYVRERERFLLRVIKFEESTYGSSKSKGPVHNHNVNAKYRTHAAKTVTGSLAKVKELIAEYQNTYGKAFEIKGVVYQHNVEQQEASIANVKTNFSGFTRETLIFLDKESDTIEDIEFHDCLNDVLAAEEIPHHEFVDHSVGILES